MVSAIGAGSLVQAMPARVETRKTQEPAAAATAIDAGTATVSSAQAVAAARVGGQLDAQFDAGRVQRAQEEVAAADGGAGETGAAAAAADTETTANAGASGTATPAAGGARAGSGAAGSSSDSAATDYIAEADTNNDRKVSEEERAAYARKQASEVAGKAAAAQSREQEVRQAYVPQEVAGSQLDVSV